MESLHGSIHLSHPWRFLNLKTYTTFIKKSIYDFFVSIYIQYKFKTSNKVIMNLPGPRRLLMIPLNAISSRYHRSTLWSDCQNKTQNWYLYNSLTSNIPIITNLNITYSSKFCNGENINPSLIIHERFQVVIAH